VVDEEPAFTREERWLRKEVSRLRGRVLDVGCGDQLYKQELIPLIDSGAVEYHGVDPDSAALQRMREAGLRGTLTTGAIEEYDAPAAYFDYVLALRSVHHVRDLERAFDVICRVLRPQGQLVLCDSLVYGLVRTPSQVRYADEHAPVGHEHYRNWSSHQLVDFLRRYPLRVDVHRPVTSQTCNEWIIKLMRTGEGDG
jgi:SAM-dependent methyltransferase